MMLTKVILCKPHIPEKTLSNEEGVELSLAVDKFLEYIAEDGEWHSLNEVTAYLQLRKDEVMEIAKFFARFGFIHLDETRRKVKIESNVRKLYASPLEEMEKLPLIATK